MPSPAQPAPSQEPAAGPHCIEVCECGVWDTQDMADNLPDALALASSLCQTLPDDKIRISTPDNRIL
jgi:hypothetical protein